LLDKHKLSPYKIKLHHEHFHHNTKVLSSKVVWLYTIKLRLTTISYVPLVKWYVDFRPQAYCLTVGSL